MALGTDFDIAAESPQVWHDVLSLSVVTAGGTSLRVAAYMSITDSSGNVNLAGFRITVDGARIGNGSSVATGFFGGGTNEAESGALIAQAAVGSGTHLVKLQAKNSSALAALSIPASTYPEVYGAAMTVDEVA